MKEIKILLVILFGFISLETLGQLQTWNSLPIRSLVYDDPVNVNDVNACYREIFTNQSNQTVFTYVNVFNIIELGVLDRPLKTYVNPYTVEVQIEYSVQNLDGSYSSDLITLGLDYSSQLNANNEAHKATQFKIPNGGSYLGYQLIAVFVDNQPVDELPENLYVQGTVYSEQYTFLDNQPTHNQPADENDADCDGQIDEFLIYTEYINGAIEYQIEYAFINDYAYGGINQSLGEADLTYDFKHNSTRLTSPRNQFSITNIFDRGWLVYRTRAIGVDPNDPDRVVFGVWNAPEKGTVELLSVENKVNIDQAKRHEPNLNWNYSVTFAEDGKKKEIVSYADGSLRTRQMVTKNNTNNHSIVGETLYDYEGREVISVLPTPAFDGCNPDDPARTIKYFQDFNIPTGQSQITKDDYDADATSACDPLDFKLSNTNGASRYYSGNNPDMNGINGYIPDAELYPYVQTEYTSDKTGRIRTQGGVGETFKLTGDHTTHYLYGKPNQVELDRMFGSEIGYSDHYSKNAVIDPNGQVSLSYLDQEGRVIATALAGEHPDNLEALSSHVAPADLTINALGNEGVNNKVIQDENGFEVLEKITLLTPSPIEINYGFQVDDFQDACTPDICLHCVYDVELILLDNCGNNVLATMQNSYSGSTPYGESKIEGYYTFDGSSYTFHNLNCPDPDATSTTSWDQMIVTTILPEGEYYLKKRITINQSAYESYLNTVLDPENNDCIMTLEDFINEELSKIDSTLCDIDCETCFDNLGTLNDYLANERGTPSSYYEELALCNKLCESQNSSVSDGMDLSKMLQIDMIPAGQYGEYLVDGVLNTTAYPLSIYNLDNQLTCNVLTGGTGNSRPWKYPKLIKKDGTVLTKYFDLNGEEARVTVNLVNGNYVPSIDLGSTVYTDPLTQETYVRPQDLKFVEDFIEYFEYDWSRSLIVYHPEYVFVHADLIYGDKIVNTDLYSSNDFDDLMYSTNTFAEAINNGFIEATYTNQTAPIDVITDWFNVPANQSTQPWDPFVARSSSYLTTDCGNFGDAFKDKFLNYQMINGVWYSLVDYAAIVARCDFGDGQFYSYCNDFGQGNDVDLLNQEWLLLKSMYFSLKSEFKKKRGVCASINGVGGYIGYNGCIANDNYSPYQPPLFSWGQVGLSFSNFSQQKSHNANQPCGFGTHHLYANKTMRCGQADNYVDQDYNALTYQQYLQTGQCPELKGLEIALNELVASGELVSLNVDLQSNTGFGAIYISKNNGNYNGSNPDYRHNGIQDLNFNLSIDWLDPSDLSNKLNLSFAPISSTNNIAWSDVAAFSNLQFMNDGTFTAKVKVPNGGTFENYLVSGSFTTNTYIFHDCQFETSPENNPFINELQDLENSLVVVDELLSASVDINPLLESSTVVYTPTNGFKNVLNLGSDLKWTFNSAGQYFEITSPNSSNPVTRIQYGGASQYDFNNLANAGSILFSEIQTIGENDFEQTLTVDGVNYSMFGSVFRNDNGVLSGLETGTNDYPVPMACEERPYHLMNDLKRVLEEKIITENPMQNGFTAISTSPYFYNGLYNEATNFGTSTTETVNYNPSTKVIDFQVGDCSIKLTPSSTTFDYSEIENVYRYYVEQEDYTQTMYNNFWVVYTMNNSTAGYYIDSVYVESCFQLKLCNQCTESSTPSSSTQTANSPFQELYSSDVNLQRYEDYLDLVSDYNSSVVNNNPLNSDYKTPVQYGDFLKYGLVGAPSQLTSLYENYISGVDSNYWIQNEKAYLYKYGSLQSAEFEYDRYLKAVGIHNSDLAGISGGLSYILTPATLNDFLSKGYSAINQNYIEYLLNLDGVGLISAIGINVFSGIPTYSVDEKNTYNSYVSAVTAYRSFADSFKTFEPSIYSINALKTLGVFENTASKNQFLDYINQLNLKGPNTSFLIDLNSLNATDAADSLFINNEILRNFRAIEKEIRSLIEDPVETPTLEEVSFLDILEGNPCDYDTIVPDPGLISTIGDLQDNLLAGGPTFPTTDVLIPCDSSTIPKQDACKEELRMFNNCLGALATWAQNEFPSGAPVQGGNDPSFTAWYNYLGGDYEGNICGCVGVFCTKSSEAINGEVTYTTAQSLRDSVYPAELCVKKPPLPCTEEFDFNFPDTLVFDEAFQDPCLQFQYSSAIFTAQNAYNEYLQQFTEGLKEQYYEKCMGVQEYLNYKYRDQQYHYTLYYYDQAGNLTKTIPPAGVKLLNIQNSDDPLSLKVAEGRKNHQQTVYTNHTLATRYEYNSLNQLIYQSTPDTDPFKEFNLNATKGLPRRFVASEIHMLDKANGFVVGNLDGRGYTYRTADGGNSWKPFYDHIAADINVSEMYDEQIGILAGKDGLILSTNNGGLSWEIVVNNDLQEYYKTINDCAILGSGSLLGYAFIGEELQYFETDDLQTFNIITAGLNEPSDANIVSITTIDDQIKIVVKGIDANGFSYSHLYYKQYGAPTWTPMNEWEVYGIESVRLDENDNISITGENGQLYREKLGVTTSSDITFKSVANNLTGTIVKSTFDSSADGFGYVIREENSVRELYGTSDGGHSWELVSNQAYNDLKLHASSNILYATGDNGLVSMYYPHPNGGWMSLDYSNIPSQDDIQNIWVLPTQSAGEVITTIMSADNSLIACPSINQGNLVWHQQTIPGISTNDFVVDQHYESAGINVFVGLLATNLGKLVKVQYDATIANFTFTIIGSATTLYNTVNWDEVNQTFVVSGVQSGANTICESFGFNGTDITNTTGNSLFQMSGAYALQLNSQNSIIGFDGSQIQHIYNNGSGYQFYNLSKSFRPSEINDLHLNPTTFLNYVVGNKGQLYIQDESDPNIPWKLVQYSEKNDLTAVGGESTQVIIGGNNGLVGELTISGNVMSVDDIHSISNDVLSDYLGNDVVLKIDQSGTEIALITQNGVVVSTDDVSLGSYKVFETNSQLNKSISILKSQNKTLIAGFDNSIYEINNGIKKKREKITSPRLNDISFDAFGNGVIVGDNYFARRFNIADQNWNILQSSISDPAVNVRYTQGVILQNEEILVSGNISQQYAQLDGVDLGTLNLSSNELQYSNYTNRVLSASGTSFKSLQFDAQSGLLNGEQTLYSGGFNINGFYEFENGNVILVGNAGNVAHLDPVGNIIQTLQIGVGDNLMDVDFVDRINGIVVGQNGTYFKIDPLGSTTDNELFLTTIVFDNPIADAYTNPGESNVSSPQQVNYNCIWLLDDKNGIVLGDYTNQYSIANTDPSCAFKVFDLTAKYSSRFFYDRLGRLVVSQNARQHAQDKYSYTLYDALGRVVEVGEKLDANQNFDDLFGAKVGGEFVAGTINDVAFANWVLEDNMRFEVTKSFYDETALSLPTNFTQDALTSRKRIVHVAYYSAYNGDKGDYDHATHYDYDIHGNVESLLQDNRKMATDFPTLADQQYKRMDYHYDLISGNVNRMSYQDGEKDQWHHAYTYDADNRIISAYTSSETPLLPITRPSMVIANEANLNSDWKKDAQYDYYTHGQLSRVLIGDERLQGMDYVYTIQGWLKGINSTNLTGITDPGKDSYQGMNEDIPTDVFGFNLSYFNTDFTPIDASGNPGTYSLMGDITNSDIASNSSELFNGNIRSMQTTLRDIATGSADYLGNAYEYDQLNRLLKSRSYANYNPGNNTWGSSGTYDNKYYNEFSYDANGNILTQKRHNSSGTLIDDLTYQYHYNQNGLVRNRLYHINDVSSDITANELLDQGIFAAHSSTNDINQTNNYQYDPEGRLVKDDSEGLSIEWRVDGKIKSIIDSDDVNHYLIEFDYDAMGDRIAKRTYNDQFELIKCTYYSLDAQGKTIATYDHKYENQTVSFVLEERYMYGSSRLGAFKEKVDMLSTVTQNNPTIVYNANRVFESSNHLGNVLVTFRDILNPIETTQGAQVTGYRVEIVSTADYSPFGVPLDGRTQSASDYRFGYQGSEKDDEIKGEGNSYTTHYRQLDPRIGMWLTIDPKTGSMPWQSPFCSMDGNPIRNNDIYGDIVPISFDKNNKALKKEFISQINDVTGGKYKIDRKGNLKAKFGKYGKTVTGRLMKEAITKDNVVIPIIVVKNDKEVYMDSYYSTKVDIGDIGAGDIGFQKGVYAHFMAERLEAGTEYQREWKRAQAFEFNEFLGVPLNPTFAREHQVGLKAESEAIAEHLGVESLPIREQGLIETNIKEGSVTITGFSNSYGDKIKYDIIMSDPQTITSEVDSPSYDQNKMLQSNVKEIKKVEN